MCEEVHQIDLTGVPDCDIARPVFHVKWPSASGTSFSLTVMDGWDLWQQNSDFQKLGGAAPNAAVAAEKVRCSKAALSKYDSDVKYKICRMPAGELHFSWSCDVLGVTRNFVCKMPQHPDPGPARLAVLRALMHNQRAHQQACTTLVVRQERMRAQITQADQLISLASTSKEELRGEMVPVLNQLKARARDNNNASSSSSDGSAASRNQSLSASQAPSYGSEHASSHHGSPRGSPGQRSAATEPSPAKAKKAVRKPGKKRTRTYGKTEPETKDSAKRIKSTKSTKELSAAGEGGQTGLTAEMDLADLE